MFNPDFYPTPEDVIFQMLDGIEIEDKIILEPSAGKGNIIDYLTLYGAKEVLFCESNEDLAHISSQKARFLESDFLNLDSSRISHIDLIVMNPPFSADEKHILHAFSIAPAGCKIISLCNAQTIKNTYTNARKELKNNIDLYGNFQNLGNCFENSERETGVEIGLVILQKPGASYSTEFEGFFLDEEEEPDGDGIMSYNFVRDLVNRYVASIKIFDRQLEEAEKMNQLTSGYFSVKMGMNVTNNQKPIQRADFKKEMQKSGWKFIFAKMNMQKYATKGMRDDINKFVEEKTEIPFTMRNIYVMLANVVQTQEQTMDKAILEVFDKVTEHYHDNRFNVEGWKTNSHYLLNQRFIFPSMVDQDKWSWNENFAHPSSYGNFERIEDLIKAICFITGDNYDEKETLNRFMRDHKMPYGVWVDWDYFRVKGHKKGTIHFEFKDRELWGRFNQRVAKLKGYPLFEKAPDKRTERQKQKAAPQPRPTHAMKVKPTVLKTYTFNPELF